MRLTINNISPENPRRGTVPEYGLPERQFRRLADLIYRHPVLPLLLVFTATLALSSQLPRLTMDVSNEGFFHDDSQILLNYHGFMDQFGREDLIIIAITPERLFDQQFLRKLARFQQELERRVPHLDEVTSLISARNTRGEGDELIVEELFESWPASDSELADIKGRALSNPFYRDLLLSADGRVTAVLVRSNTYAGSEDEQEVLQGFDDGPVMQATASEQHVWLDDVQQAEVTAATLQVVEQFHGDDFPLAVSGVPVITGALKAVLRRDFIRFLSAGLVVSVTLLYVMFRRSSGVWLPLATIFLTLLTTLGLMAATGTAFKVQTQILPSFLMAVSIGAAVHVLSMFYKRFDETGDKRQSIVDAMGHTGAPVLAACMTTAVGLLSFSNSSLAPLADLGIFAGVGILLSLLYTLIMIPAFLALLPVKRRPLELVTNGPMTRMLTALAHFSMQYSKAIIVFCALGTLVAIGGLLRLNFYHEPLSWFPDGTPVRVATEAIDRQLKGVQTIEVVVDTKQENGLYEPVLLNSLEVLDRRVRALQINGIQSEKTLSIVDVIKEINLALNENRPEFYTIPQNRDLIAQELLLFENSGSDDLEDFVDSQFSKARFSVKITWSDAASVDRYLDQLQLLLTDTLAADLDVQITGGYALYSHIAMESMHSMKQSYLLAAVVISLLMILFIGNLKIGLIAMIPNLSPIFITLGAMGIFNLPLAVFTMFIGSIALGLAVDDTLHFLHGFHRFHLKTGDTEKSILLTFQSTGRALTVTTVALALGFFIFMFATLENQVLFGLLTGMTIVLALFADFILTPAILKEIVPDRQVAGASVVEGAVL